MLRLNDKPASEESTTLLLYGNSGTGKTFFIGSAGNRTLIISPSNGLSTLQSKLFTRDIGSNPIIEVIDEEPLPPKATAFDKYSDVIDLYLEKHLDEFDTIIVDDATALRRVALTKGLELNSKLGRSKTLGQSKEVIVPTVQDYGIEMNLVEQFCRHYTALCKNVKKNFVLTAHERQIYEKAEKIGELDILKKILPGFTGKTFPDDITGLFDCTWHTEIRGAGDRTYYQIRTQGDSQVVAKTRWGGLFPVLIEKQPRLDVVFNCIKTQTPIPKV